MHLLKLECKRDILQLFEVHAVMIKMLIQKNHYIQCISIFAIEKRTKCYGILCKSDSFGELFAVKETTQTMLCLTQQFLLLRSTYNAQDKHIAQ